MTEQEISLKKFKNHLNLRERKKIPLIDGFRQAAVLIPIVITNGEKSLIFVKRTSNVTHHKGEIAFPGGKFDKKTDQTITFTSLRELEEEIGLTDVEVLGSIDDITTITKFVVTPVVGIINDFSNLNNLKIDKNEVDYAIKVPLSFFFNEKNLEIKDINFNDKKYDIPFFYYKNEVIWGATGRIILNLLEILKDLYIDYGKF